MRDIAIPAPTQPVRRTSPPSPPAEETARLGDEIYERDIRHQVEVDHHGEVVAIDVNSGDYAIAENVVTAWERLVSRHPDGGFWFVRVGYPAVYHLGGRPLRSAS